MGAGARVTQALAGDTMLGRGVARALESAPSTELFAPAVVAAAREADLFVLNLECCISARGERRPDPGKPFFFLAPPVAVDVLRLLGVDFSRACAELGTAVAHHGERLVVDFRAGREPGAAGSPQGRSGQVPMRGRATDG